jgi:hypothetical protein
MASDSTEQTTAAKTESAGQSMYRGAGKETVNLYAGNIVQIGRRSDGSRSVVFRSTSSTFRYAMAEMGLPDCDGRVSVRQADPGSRGRPAGR